MLLAEVFVVIDVILVFFEEVIQLDPLFTKEVVIPLLNKPREDSKGRVNPKEPHGSKIFITTAGYQGTYAYDKQIETLIYAALDPTQYMVLGGSYTLPVMHKLLQEKTIRELITSISYERDTFEREYMSIWSGAPAGAVFTANTITNLRKNYLCGVFKQSNFRSRSRLFFMLYQPIWRKMEQQILQS